MASPMVAGLLGLMQFLNPTMPDADLIQCLYFSADNLSDVNPSFSGQLGAGRINAAKAMECVSGSLNRAPVADFTSTNPALVAGGSIIFTDQSSYSPASWQWSFPGGSPSTFNGKTPPSIVYNTIGQYNVSLTVTNPNGGNTLTKTNFVNVTAPPTCLRVNLPFPDNWQLYNYQPPFTNGHVNGNHSNREKQKAMQFNLFGTNNTTLTSVAIAFGSAYTLFPEKIVTVRVFNGDLGSPGVQLATYPLTMGEIMADYQAGDFTVIDFPQSITLPPNKQFFVSVDFSTLEWDQFGFKDSLAILSNVGGQTVGTPIWSMGSDNVWRRYGTAGTWNLTNASLLIHPFVTPNPAKSVISPKTASICSGNIVNFNSAGSTFGDTLQWVLPGASAPQIINNQAQITPLYPNGGSFKAYLLTRGGCQEVRMDSAVVTVTQSPVISVNTAKNPICLGETATLTASGATSYSWSPSTGLNTTTGAVVQANPQQTASYSITGTTGNCSSIASYELDVRPTSANVNLLASQTGITQPTSVSFTATPTGGGSNPLYNFQVNNGSVQNSGSNLLVRTVSPGDKIKCVMTSNEACVAEKTVTSNEVTMINSPLPINLFSFSGRRTNGGNQLNWVTASEANSAKFVVERSSDGQSYTTIGEVAAAGNSNSSRSYGFLDSRMQTGDNYYRLKMVDKDGSFRYSNVVRIGSNSTLMITSVQPNPTTAGTRALLVITDGERGAANITVSNVAGQVLKSYRVNNNTGNVQVELSTDNMASGNYLVTYRNSKGEVIETIRWTIIR
jgi:PKD repeat protein